MSFKKHIEMIAEKQINVLVHSQQKIEKGRAFNHTFYYIYSITLFHLSYSYSSEVQYGEIGNGRK